MASGADDSSTDIDKRAGRFCRDMEGAWADFKKTKGTKDKKSSKADEASKDATPAEIPTLTFSVSKNSSSNSRTPKQQAAEVAAGRSSVCWSAHMSDKSRHILMTVDGKAVTDSAKVEKLLGDYFDDFTSTWGMELKTCGLVNYRGRDGWGGAGDGFHVELPESKISQTDERAVACMEEYARLTREDGKKKNDKFEREYASSLKGILKKYDNASKKP